MIGCGDTPIFTEMKTSRLKIVIKGTLETEGPSNFVSMETFNLDSEINSSPFQDDSVDEVTDSTFSGTVTDVTRKDSPPTTFMLDIAEIRLNGAKISDYRQVFTIPLDDASDHPFFNGTGIELVTDDPGAGNYDSVQLYIRKMAFNNAKLYQLVGNKFSFEKNAEMIFNEKTVNGFDFNQLSVNSYWDSLRTESSEIIRVFPVQIPIIGGMTYSKENGETVLEIRLVVKNFIKKYEYDFYSAGVYKVCHYYAFSDWLRDVKAGESDIGRNLHAVARAYVKGKTGSVTVASGSSTRYVVAIPSSEVTSNLSNYSTTLSGSALRINNVGTRGIAGSSDLPLAPAYPGSYIEPILDYYLKYEKYKSDWTTQVAGLTFDDYKLDWNNYELAVHGDPDGIYNYGLKIPPYVGYGANVTFSNMTPGTYKFYYIEYDKTLPANYGKLFLDTEFQPLFLGADKVINQGAN